MTGTGEERAVMLGGANIYGYQIGILMIEGRFPRPPGAIGNALTFSFPVLHHVVRGGTGEVVARQAPRLSPDSQQWREVVAPWIAGAQELERQGCRAITTSCGFAVLFQEKLAASVSIPVWSSSLLLGSFIARGLSPAKKLGIITGEKASLLPAHFEAAGLDYSRCAIIGMEGCSEFEAMAWNDQQTTLDVEQVKAEIVAMAQRLVDENPDVGAILFECSLFPPYAAAVQDVVSVPVFDFTHLVNMVHDAVRRHPFS
jgi:hypothetical protein